MAQIDEFIKQQGTFLKAEHVKEESTAEIVDVSEIVHSEKFDTDRLHVPVKLDGENYTFDCSKTNARTISKMLGSDTAKWIGKVLELETYKTKTSDGKMVEAINVKAIKA